MNYFTEFLTDSGNDAYHISFNDEGLVLTKSKDVSKSIRFDELYNLI